MSDVTCPECLLTPSAGTLLTRVREDLEHTRPDDSSWWVETCTRCHQPRTIHDDRDGWSFGDAAADERRETPSLFDVAPEWVTLHEATYAARVSGDLFLEWAEAGRIDHVSLLPGDDPGAILLRTADIRAVLGSATEASVAATSWNRGDETETEAGRPQGVTRRRILVGLGAAITGLVPVGALAVKPAFDTVGDARGTATGKGGAGGTTGRNLSIRSVTVEPDPVAAGGSALITINTSSAKRRTLSFSLTTSEGVLTQHPDHPWMWTWRDA
jgi:hypothetical protein